MNKDEVKPRKLIIPEIGRIKAFAFFVDINGFAHMVNKAEETGDAIAQFTRDCLDGVIQSIERVGGEVVGFMGDAVYGVIGDGDAAVRACFGIAKDIDRQCEYVSNNQDDCESLWSFCPGGPSVKIAVEFGALDISTIHSNFLGSNRILIGRAINYAARISGAGRGNRCLIGPVAAKMEFASYGPNGPKFLKGKRGEGNYEYYEFPLGDFWIEGPRKKHRDTFWG